MRVEDEDSDHRRSIRPVLDLVDIMIYDKLRVVLRKITHPNSNLILNLMWCARLGTIYLRLASLDRLTNFTVTVTALVGRSS